jgi:hypothetical protein
MARVTPIASTATCAALRQVFGPPGNNQERGLEGVLRFVDVAQDLAANPPDHRPMTVDEYRECSLTGCVRNGAGGVAFQQLGVAQPRDEPALKQCPQITQDARSVWPRHRQTSHVIRSLRYYNAGYQAGGSGFFWTPSIR